MRFNILSLTLLLPLIFAQRRGGGGGGGSGAAIHEVTNSASGSCPNEELFCRYAFNKVDAHTYKLMIQYTDSEIGNRCLVEPGMVPDDNCDQLADCTPRGSSHMQQQWEIIPVDTETYTLENINTGMCLAYDSVYDTYDPKPCDSLNPAQQWIIRPQLDVPTSEPTPAPSAGPTSTPTSAQPSLQPTSSPVTSAPSTTSPTKNPISCEQNNCLEGYCDKTFGKAEWSIEGEDCVGGPMWTDGYLNCACIPEDKADTLVCYPQGVCDDGYMDKTHGNVNEWRCGENCPGGKYWTDGVCGCACVPVPPECEEISAARKCYPRNSCQTGFMDKTNGNAKWWACGADCEGGIHWTDVACNCACIPAGECSKAATYHNFNIFRSIPSLSFIRSIGVLGDYIAIFTLTVFIGLMVFMCYKKRQTNGKYGSVSTSFDFDSDVEKDQILQ